MNFPNCPEHFRKIQVENTTIIAHEIDKLRLQIIEALHIKTKKTKINLNQFWK